MIFLQMNSTTYSVLLKDNSAQPGFKWIILVGSPSNKTPFMRFPSLLTVKKKFGIHLHSVKINFLN